MRWLSETFLPGQWPAVFQRVCCVLKLMENKMAESVAAITIGRNEGERLKRCLASLEGLVAPIVYVDSGSTDGSVAAARNAGAEVVELDPSAPFTAARARNVGLVRLSEIDPDGTYVQFLDGD